MTYASISGIWKTISVIPLRKLILLELGLLEQAISIYLIVAIFYNIKYIKNLKQKLNLKNNQKYQNSWSGNNIYIISATPTIFQI
tara:strand:- start:37 stop:291 length:255 start_codon:yes stop_codon:yes gene_type:complete